MSSDPKRSLYIWQLQPIINSEGSVRNIVAKARRAKIKALWVKIADGRAAYRNVTGDAAPQMQELIERCHDSGIEVWGWHVPCCANAEIAREETGTIQSITDNFALDGLIMDAEHGPGFFQGGEQEAKIYAVGMRELADEIQKPLAISSHDIPQNSPGWLLKFNIFASVADFNYPQVYYGGSLSVLDRLSRAEEANAHLSIPFRPVGAGWVGDGGGCSSAPVCADWASQFMTLVKERGYDEYSFWHWADAPNTLWQLLENDSL